MKLVEISITVGYFVAIIGIALLFRRKAGKGETAYLGAGRQIGFVVTGFAQFSGLISAASFLGFVGLAYTKGWSYTTVAFGVGSSMGFIMSMLLAAGPLRRYSELKGKFTLSGFFADRFGRGMSLAATLFILVLFPIYISAQLKGGGLAGVYLLGVHPNYAIMLMAVVYVLYVCVGGMLSAAWIDFVQGILMWGMMVGLSLTGIAVFGGLGSMLEQVSRVPAGQHFMDIQPAAKLSPWTYFGMSLGVLVFVLSSPHIIMRLFIVRNVKQGRAALSLTSALTITFHALGYLGVAAAAILLVPNLMASGDPKAADATYMVAMERLFPPVLKGLAVAGIMAAIMSTTGVILLAVGAEFTQNIFRRFIWPKATGHQTIWVARITMMVVGIGTAFLAMWQSESIGVVVSAVLEGTGSAFVVPLLAGLWWRRANRTGGVLSGAGGFLSFVIVHYWFTAGPPPNPVWRCIPPSAEILISLPISIVLMVVGSLLTAPPPPEQMSFVDALHREQPTPEAVPTPVGVV